ncbi:T9SS type A sorting domain-containing protein [Reichenbachiella carrageenanivorans]|uniref:T9SS type A sorting domain-containing protein n=1 Tax=Reichenbachiella carrageenanivorans TaxID=2979869 RepID=A0ABY6CUX1_9BACT|nr:chondroitinase-B domain-containing protein [Reichenbachiella carrageenanivorans]UXX77663.1 T9SS type A sorting domain-containing protein [Reichenbachiella carrageenanivorans]
MKTRLLNLLVCLLVTQFAYAQTVISTSFDDYTLGGLEGQDAWEMHEGGIANVVTTPAYIRTGSQGVQFGTPTESEIALEHLSYDPEVTGLGSTVYIDCWIKVLTVNTVEPIIISGYDLFGGSSKRTFMFEISTSGILNAYSSWSKIAVPSESYTMGEWMRLSVSANYATATYEAAVNGNIIDGTLDFRENYSTNREPDTKEYHSLRIYSEGGITDIALDYIYVGTDVITDIAFTAPSIERTITVTQPENATITLSPDQEIYEVGTEVTVAITEVADHYVFEKWTGGFSGSSTSFMFTVDNNVSFGASIIVDDTDPPAEYTIDITQPPGGTITVSPAEGPYYVGDEITFSIVPAIGYEFTSWSGITGNSDEEVITIDQDLTVSAVMTPGTFSERIVNVANNSQLEDAIDDMLPGDRIILANGTYDGAGGSIKNLGGTADYPVSIEAANIGEAKFTGSSYFSLTNCAYITFKGFDFDVEVYTLFKLTGCNNIRISQNVFKNTGDDGSKLILIGDIWEATSCNSHHNRVDHNLFDGKDDSGAWLVIDGSHGGTPQVSQYDRIDHNHFRNNGPRVTNEKETIRIGMSDLSLSSAFCTVENNLFEACDGDPEIISVKSGQNYIRNNTFLKSLGTVSLRHGDGSEVSGNYFLGQGKTAIFEENTIGCGGVRVYGKDHKIFNNYFEGLTGSLWDAACTLTQGDATNSNVTNSSDLTKHYLVENLEFTHNTLVNNASDIEIGYRTDWGKPPVNCLIANNIIVQDTNPVTTLHEAGAADGVTFADNIIYTTGDATWGDLTFTASEAANVNPLLASSDCRASAANCPATVPYATYKLTSLSPAIDASVTNTMSYITTDSEGQATETTRDLGADEYNSTDPITNGLMDATHVGPDAIDYTEGDGRVATEEEVETEEETEGEGENEEGETITITTVDPSERTVQVYPNPFTRTTKFEATEEAYITIYSISGHQVATFRTINEVEWTAPKQGVYIAHVLANKVKYTIKLVAN